MEQFIKPMEQFIKLLQKYLLKWKISFEYSKDIDEHGKQSSLEDYSIKIIGTRPPISSHVSPIGQNIVIPNTIFSVKKYKIIIGKLVDNMIICIINHNLWYKTTVNSIVVTEEFNNILTKKL